MKRTPDVITQAFINGICAYTVKSFYFITNFKYLEWIERAKEEKKKSNGRIELSYCTIISLELEFVSWDAIDQLSKTTILLGVSQIVLIILFATVGGKISNIFKNLNLKFN
jgi:hypothetical protein